MVDYRYLSHTADVEFIAYGSTMDTAFKNALMALFETLSYTKKVSKDRSKAKTFMLREKVKTVEDLLCYTLQDAISITDMKSMFAYKVTGLKIKKSGKQYILVAKVYAKERKNEYSKLDVKGVSMYDLKVGKEKGKFFARAVVDV